MAEDSIRDELVLGAVNTFKTSYSTHFEENFNVDGSPASVDLEKIFNAPQDYISDIVGYSKYCYRKHGIIMRVVNIIRDFGACGFDLSYPTKAKKIEEVITAYNKKVDLDQLIKDMIFELALTGNLACYDRDGERVDIYPISQIKVIPLIKNNKQMIAYKTPINTISYDTFNKQIDTLIESAYPKEITEARKKNLEYGILDTNKSYFAKINASQYESYGISVILPAFEDLSHKSLLKEAEKSTANDIIDKIMLVQVGDKDNKPNKDLIKQYDSLFNGISGSVRVTAPYYVDIKWVEPETNIFGEEKFVEIDTDILNTLGVSLTLIRGEGGGNYAEGMLNFTGLTRTIEGIRLQIPNIIEGLYRSELERNGLNPDHSPIFSFKEVVIDKEAKLNLVKELFTTAGLPYQVLYEQFGMDFDYIKLIREDENTNKVDETFKVRSLPFQGQNGDNQNNTEGQETQPQDKGGAPKKTSSERKTDKTASNNDAPRTGAKGRT